jgi:pimeloyl-ACP methyl ester carboxylesterase
MAHIDRSGLLELPTSQLEYRLIGPLPEEAPTLVLLHEGLGSVGLWGDFPDRLSASTGTGVFVFSRAGYGSSSPITSPRPLTYMQDEALSVLPRVLDAIGFRRGLLVGHSDGASIATIYAGGVQDHRVRGLSLIAPHFFVEEVSIAAIAEAKIAYDKGDLKRGLARWHRDVDGAFRGWNDAWLDPDFRGWDITDSLAYIRVPIQIIQGEADQYGTMRQVEVAQDECYCPVDVAILPGVGHSPHREAPEALLTSVSEFADRILMTHGEGRAGHAA